MMMHKVKSIASERGQSFEQVAAETEVSRGQLYRICRGRSGGSPRFWRAMIRWSDGRITPNDFFADALEGVGDG
jgi:transcriptional regulator with XRE-family HTH domain